MISAQSRPYIDASVPVLREHGVAITTAFYRNMFAAHPELTNLFNMGNQANGAQQQSLAAAVFAYAANIDNPAALAPVIQRIVHKHVSLGITPEHYPIVGRYLLGGIAEVLGDAATPALLAAWAEAYGSLAQLFIDAERAMYAASGTLPGALRPMRVFAVAEQGADVRAYTLEPADGLPAPAFHAGQYVSVAVTFGDGRRQLRQYSVSDAPGAPLRISVKRERANDAGPDGEVSNWLHQHVEVGSVLQVSHPFGDFAPDTESSEPLVLLSAGVGITPMIAALNRIAKVNPGRPVVFAHAARDAAHHAHQADVAAALAVMPNLQVVNFYESDPASGRMDVARLPAWPRGETNVYMCGPVGFMRAQWQDLLAAGVPVQRLHREVFGPDALDV
ncbi:MULTISPECIES: globin domain-containing protein [unclassified Janthinobacterium]|uniref:globin domain-containing protein n=1 Tax=unclassified Janthinobacterium TaxID=2610881 RepID=UPI00034D9014|nr:MULTISPECIES: globin domain-containing protein [unclassified Janthinobacterium]MEC5162488.1 nitric oxide dioxygenase [Janthinobacterium sp. CG_S6]